MSCVPLLIKPQLPPQKHKLGKHCAAVPPFAEESNESVQHVQSPCSECESADRFLWLPRKWSSWRVMLPHTDDVVLSSNVQRGKVRGLQAILAYILDYVLATKNHTTPPPPTIHNMIVLIYNPHYWTLITIFTLVVPFVSILHTSILCKTDWGMKHIFTNTKEKLILTYRNVKTAGEVFILIQNRRMEYCWWHEIENQMMLIHLSRAQPW